MGYDATVWVDAGMSAIKLQKGADTPAETAVVNQKTKESVLAFIKAILARPERFELPTSWFVATHSKVYFILRL